MEKSLPLVNVTDPFLITRATQSPSMYCTDSFGPTVHQACTLVNERAWHALCLLLGSILASEAMNTNIEKSKAAIATGNSKFIRETKQGGTMEPGRVGGL